MTIKHQKTRERILEKSLLTFGKFGYTKTSIFEIAKACNKGRRTIYTYFRNKKDIYNEVIKSECIKLSGFVTQKLEIAKEPQQKLSEFVVVRMFAIRKLVFSYNALTCCYFKKRSHFEKIRKEYDNQEKVIIASILKEGVEKNIFSITCIDKAATNLQLALKAFEDFFIKEKLTKEDREQQDDLINVLLFGLINRYSVL